MSAPATITAADAVAATAAWRATLPRPRALERLRAEGRCPPGLA